MDFRFKLDSDTQNLWIMLNRFVLLVSYFKGYHKITDEIMFVKNISAVTFLNETYFKNDIFLSLQKKTDLC